MTQAIKILLCALLVASFGQVSAAEKAFTTIEWEDLMPPVPEGDTLSLKDLSEDWLGPPVDAPDDGSDVTDMSDPRDPETQLSHRGRVRPPQEVAPVVEKLNGKHIRLAGYVVPLDFKATKVREFLLVPYVGACIHVPAPPTNQVVFVETAEPMEVTGLFDPVYVTGTMSIGKSKTVLAEAGYRIDATNIAPYE